VSELLTIMVDARTAQEAQEAVVKWVRAHPQIRLVRLTRVRPAMTSNAPDLDKWAVEIAYVPVEPGSGL